MKAWVGRVYALSGRKSEALKVLAEMTEMSKHEHVAPYPMATLYAALGEKDRAFEWLEKVYEERSYYVVFLNVDRALDDLREDPRFSDLLRRIGLVWLFDGKLNAGLVFVAVCACRKAARNAETSLHFM